MSLIYNMIDNMIYGNSLEKYVEKKDAESMNIALHLSENFDVSSFSRDAIKMFLFNSIVDSKDKSYLSINQSDSFDNVTFIKIRNFSKLLSQLISEDLFLIQYNRDLIFEYIDKSNESKRLLLREKSYTYLELEELKNSMTMINSNETIKQLSGTNKKIFISPIVYRSDKIICFEGEIND